MLMLMLMPLMLMSPQNGSAMLDCGNLEWSYRSTQLHRKGSSNRQSVARQREKALAVPGGNRSAEGLPPRSPHLIAIRGRRVLALGWADRQRSSRLNLAGASHGTMPWLSACGEAAERRRSRSTNSSIPKAFDNASPASLIFARSCSCALLVCRFRSIFSTIVGPRQSDPTGDCLRCVELCAPVRRLAGPNAEPWPSMR